MRNGVLVNTEAANEENETKKQENCQEASCPWKLERKSSSSPRWTAKAPEPRAGR